MNEEREGGRGTPMGGPLYPLSFFIHSLLPKRTQEKKNHDTAFESSRVCHFESCRWENLLILYDSQNHEKK